jgi:hypothetical protein
VSRIRTIKPEFWSSEQVMACSPLARLLFIGLWNFCDDSGRHPYTPRTLKALIFASDDITTAEVGAMLEELAEAGLIAVYSVGGKQYLQVTGWQHQRINHPQPPRHPGPPNGGGGRSSLPTTPGPAPNDSRNEAAPAADETGLLPDQSRNHTQSEKPNSGNSTGPIPDRSGTIPGPFSPESESESESEKISEADASLVDEAVDPGPISFEKPKKDREALRLFGEAWNQLAAALDFPAIEEIEAGSTRERHALARLRKMPPNGVQALMARIRGSPYLRGEVNGFRVSFDWIVNASNYTKIMEGNYEDRKIASLRR